MNEHEEPDLAMDVDMSGEVIGSHSLSPDTERDSGDGRGTELGEFDSSSFDEQLGASEESQVILRKEIEQVDNSHRVGNNKSVEALQSEILSALLDDADEDGSALFEKHQKLRQTIFGALKKDLKPQAVHEEVKDESKSENSPPHISSGLTAREQMYSKLETIEDAIMSPSKQGIDEAKPSRKTSKTSKTSSASTYRNLNDLERTAMAKSSSDSGLGVGSHFDSSGTSPRRIANIERLEAAVLRKSTASSDTTSSRIVVARTGTTNLESLESDVLSNSMAPSTSSRGDNTVRAASTLNNLENQVRSKSVRSTPGRLHQTLSIRSSGSNEVDAQLKARTEEENRKAQVDEESPAATEVSGESSDLVVDTAQQDHREPGAVYVTGRAGGEVPRWRSRPTEDSRSRMASDVAIASEVVEPVISAQKVLQVDPRKAYCKYVLLAAVVLSTTLIVGLSVGLTSNNKNTASIPDPCLDDPDILTQCSCNNSIYQVSQDQAASYDNVTNALIATGIEIEYAQPNTCDPAVVSRLLIADGLPMSELELHQKYALNVFYFSLNGSTWSNTGNWITNKNVCDEWTGVICTEEGVVNEVHLANANLRGQLPSEISILSDMKVIEINNNEISGTLPSEMQTMNLRRFGGEENMLSGSFIPSLLPRSITILRLNYNRFTGSIPADEIASLSKLRRLQLHGNQLIGTLPSEIAALTSLRYFNVAYNKFTGSLPDEYKLLANLDYIQISNNSLTGTVPESWQRLSKMETMVLDNTQLVGMVPEIFCQSFTFLETLVGDCGVAFNANCTCCICWEPDLALDR